MTVSQFVEVKKPASSVEEFISLRDQVACTPEGGAVMMIMALLAYVEDADLGRQCLTIAVDRGRLASGPKGYKNLQLSRSGLQRIEMQIEKQVYLPSSYVKGASPENGYRLPDPPYTFQCSDNRYSGDASSGTYKLFVSCSGASSPRPVTVKMNDKGIWKASEWSSLIVGIQAPQTNMSDDL